MLNEINQTISLIYGVWKTKQHTTQIYRGQMGSYQIGKGKRVGEMSEGGHLYDDGW